MTWDLAFTLLKRFWWSIPITGLAVLLLLARSDARHWHKQADGYQQQLTLLEASYRAAQDTAKAANLTAVTKAETDGAQIAKDHDDALEKQLADARALADDYARRLRSAAADQGAAGQGDLSKAPRAAQGADGAGGMPVMDASDLQVCSVNTVKAHGWQAFYRDVKARYDAMTQP